jgi:hypothetical protein
MAEITVTTPFFDAFWPALAAGVLVLVIGYIAISWLLGLRERARNQKRTRDAVLQIVHGELLHNASEATTWKEELPTMGVPFPGFELGGWGLVSQMDALLSLSPSAADRLVHAYNRMRSCNDQLATLRDLNSGASALNVELHVAAAVRPDGKPTPAMQIVIHEFEQLKRDTRDALLRRVADLEPYLTDAIDAVEHEIRVAAPVPAAQRLFRHTTPPDFIGGNRS